MYRVQWVCATGQTPSQKHDKLTSHTSPNQSNPGSTCEEVNVWIFPIFEFKMRLIRLGFSFMKQKFLYLNSQTTDSQSGVITITLKIQLWVGDTENVSVTFSYA